jgi:peptide/nickel transport system substrate-binding protein
MGNDARGHVNNIVSRFALVLAALALVWPGAARAQKADDTLRVTWRDTITNVDPYYNPLRSGLVLAHQAWDTLMDRDPDTFVLKPLLATSWRYVDDTTIEFTLRHGVTFQDGSPFSADDVVYTINTVIADPKVAVPSNYSFIDGATKIADDKVQVKLKRVFPAALEYLAMVMPIWPQAYRERIGAEAYARAPIGTGPYRITKIDGTQEIDLERYDGYYPGSPKGRPAIRNIVIHEVPDAQAELVDLLAGRADWIWNLSPDTAHAVAAAAGLQVLRAESMRVDYLSLDAAGRTGSDSPLTNPKVRQAIFFAIDRQKLARDIVGSGARVPDAPCFPTQFGCDQAVATRYPYDPAKARQLLADAGYPNGFDVEMVSYELPVYEAAIQANLQAIGINLRISHVGIAPFVERTLAGTVPIGLGSWGSYSINDVSAFLPYFFNGDNNDYSDDPEVQLAVAAGTASINPDDRRKFYSTAIRRITAQAYFLPLNTEVTSYGVSRTLNFRPDADELPRFYLSSWR